MEHSDRCIGQRYFYHRRKYNLFDKWKWNSSRQGDSSWGSQATISSTNPCNKASPESTSTRATCTSPTWLAMECAEKCHFRRLLRVDFKLYIYNQQQREGGSWKRTSSSTCQTSASTTSISFLSNHSNPWATPTTLEVWFRLANLDKSGFWRFFWKYGAYNW
jgi:hypothetical protein